MPKPEVSDEKTLLRIFRSASAILGKIPYFHLVPRPIFEGGAVFGSVKIPNFMSIFYSIYTRKWGKCYIKI